MNLTIPIYQGLQDVFNGTDTAVVLSLATTLSAWCAYQATRWGGVQTLQMAAASKAGRESSTATIDAAQMRAFDTSVFISYILAKNDGNQRQEKFLYDRFRPELKKAVDAWLKTDPFKNPAGPLGPFKMAEYSQQGLADAKHQDELFDQSYAATLRAKKNSDSYVLLTVMFASVLFFGGIAMSLNTYRMCIPVLGIALTLFVLTLVFLATVPICRE